MNLKTQITQLKRYFKKMLKRINIDDKKQERDTVAKEEKTDYGFKQYNHTAYNSKLNTVL